MIHIDVTKIRNWEKIKEKHKNWFYEQFSHNFVNHEELYRNLTDGEKDFIGQIFGISEAISNKKLTNNKNEISLFVVQPFVHNNIEKLKFDYKQFNSKNLTRILQKLFNYEQFTNKNKEKWCRNKFFNLLEIEVCPYCQRNHISNFIDESDYERTTADLDHFYSQTDYPFLALSLYNFIPSCKTCNSTMKGKKGLNVGTHIYPYNEGFEKDIKFILSNDAFIDNILDKTQLHKVKIINNSKNDEKIKRINNNRDVFKLDSLYKESHSAYIEDMVDNFIKYPKTYTDNLSEFFIDENSKEKNVLDDYFRDIIKKPYLDKINKGEPLAKLTKDILEDIGIKLD